MSHAHHEHDVGGPLPFIAIAVLLVLIVATVAGIRIFDGVSRDTPASAVVDRELYFRDLGQGRILVVDASSDEVLQSIGPGEQGFMRATVRGLAQQRLRQGDGDQVPFMLSGRADGRLLLEDPVTGRVVDLTAFGPTNAAVFADLLPVAVNGRR
jgi:putative photosynthetic complex assembly protein